MVSKKAALGSLICFGFQVFFLGFNRGMTDKAAGGVLNSVIGDLDEAYAFAARKR